MSGLVGAVAALALPEALVRAPAVRLAVDVLLLAGGYGLLRWALARATLAEADALVPALAPVLAAPTVVRVLARTRDVPLDVALEVTVLFEATLLAAALVAWRSLRRPELGSTPSRDRGLAVGIVGGVAPVALVSTFLVGGLPRPGHLVVVVGSLAAAGLVVLVQRRVGGRLPGKAALLGGWAPATVAGAQLLDGLVTSFAVSTPLGLVLPVFGEGNPISEAFLEAVGPGFAILKYGVGLATGLVLEASFEADDGPHRPALRVGAYLLVLRFSLSPGVFSALQLLR